MPLRWAAPVPSPSTPRRVHCVRKPPLSPRLGSGHSPGPRHGSGPGPGSGHSPSHGHSPGPRHGSGPGPGSGHSPGPRHGSGPGPGSGHSPSHGHSPGPRHGSGPGPGSGHSPGPRHGLSGSGHSPGPRHGPSHDHSHSPDHSPGPRHGLSGSGHGLKSGSGSGSKSGSGSAADGASGSRTIASLVDFRQHTLPLWRRRVEQLERRASAPTDGAPLPVADLSFLERAAMRMDSCMSQVNTALAALHHESHTDAVSHRSRTVLLDVETTTAALRSRVQRLLSRSVSTWARAPTPTKATTSAAKIKTPRSSRAGGSCRSPMSSSGRLSSLASSLGWRSSVLRGQSPITRSESPTERWLRLSREPAWEEMPARNSRRNSEPFSESSPTGRRHAMLRSAERNLFVTTRERRGSTGYFVDPLNDEIGTRHTKRGVHVRLGQQHVEHPLLGLEERRELLEQIASLERCGYVMGKSDLQRAKGYFQRLYGTRHGPRRYVEWLDDLAVRALRQR